MSTINELLNGNTSKIKSVYLYLKSGSSYKLADSAIKETYAENKSMHEDNLIKAIYGRSRDSINVIPVEPNFGSIGSGNIIDIAVAADAISELQFYCTD